MSEVRILSAVPTDAGFRGRSFSALDDRRDRFASVLSLLRDPDGELRVLDVGCGSGEQLLALAERLPRATLVGIDISPSSVAQAEHAAMQTAARERVRFVSADYLQFSDGRFDLIVSDSVLHLVECRTETLFSKLKDDLREDGLLAITMPRACAYNHLLWSLRRVLRAVRSRWVDRVIYAAGRALHRGRVPPEQILERVYYMYLLPYRFFSNKLDLWLERGLGFRLEHREAIPATSLAQPRHDLRIFRRIP